MLVLLLFSIYPPEARYVMFVTLEGLLIAVSLSNTEQRMLQHVSRKSTYESVLVRVTTLSPK